MDRRKLEKIEQEIEAARGSPQKANRLERIAKRLGRKSVKRGKEPTWESTDFNHLYPLSIPHHGGKDIPTGTAKSILDQLQEDVDAWREWLDNDN